MLTCGLAGVEGLVVVWKRSLAAPTAAAAVAGAERWESAFCA